MAPHRTLTVFISFIAETTIRAANNHAWGTNLVAGLGSLTRSSVQVFWRHACFWLACIVLFRSNRFNNNPDAHCSRNWTESPAAARPS